MMNLIRIGDDTDHDGKVITGSSTMRFEGSFVARKGDEVSCPKRPDVKPNLIEEGDASMTANGIPDRPPWSSSYLRLPSDFEFDLV